MKLLGEWQRMWYENLVYRDTLDQVRETNWTPREKESCTTMIEDKLAVNHNMMDKIEQLVKKYSFRVNELYCLN